MENPTGEIIIKLEGASLEQTERCRQIIHRLFEQGVLSVRNGRAILHFDTAGNMAAIDIEVGKWRRDKPDIPIVKPYDTATIKMNRP